MMFSLTPLLYSLRGIIKRKSLLVFSSESFFCCFSLFVLIALFGIPVNADMDEKPYLMTKKLVLVDDGSTASRVMSFCFGRNSVYEEYRLIRQSPMTEASSLSLDHGGIDKKSAEIIARLLADQEFCKSGNGQPEKTAFFLGATAGKRSNRGNVGELFRMIRLKLEAEGVTTRRYDIEMRLLEGWKEGAMNWLAVNYFYGSFGTGKGQFGIVELGGKSAQMAFSLSEPGSTFYGAALLNNIVENYDVATDDYSFLNIDRIDDERPGVTVFSESKMGYGLRHAYMVYEQKSEANPCESSRNGVGNFAECQKVMNSLFQSKDSDSSLIFRKKENYLYQQMPETFYLSGYFYDYTVHLGLHSHLTIDDISKTAEYVCNSFTETHLESANKQKGEASILDIIAAALPTRPESRVVTDPKSFKISGSIQPVDYSRLCGTLTYMVSLLKELGITSRHQLIAVKSFTYDGNPYPATWSPGYAYAWANGYVPSLLQTTQSAEKH